MGHTDPGEYFTVGLLMESGLFMLARHDNKTALESARSPARARPTLERAAGLRDHAGVGAEMVLAWNMSEDMVSAIARHHDAQPPSDSVGKVIWLAERCAGVFEGGDLAANRRIAIEAAEQVGVTQADLEVVLQQIPGEVRELARAFDRDLGPQPDIESLLRDANAGLAEINQSYQEVVFKLEKLVREKEALAIELAAANERLSMLAATDALTGLANHRAFQDALKRDLWARPAKVLRSSSAPIERSTPRNTPGAVGSRRTPRRSSVSRRHRAKTAAERHLRGKVALAQGVSSSTNGAQ